MKSLLSRITPCFSRISFFFLYFTRVDIISIESSPRWALPKTIPSRPRLDYCILEEEGTELFDLKDLKMPSVHHNKKEVVVEYPRVASGVSVASLSCLKKKYQ
jgi:hypothetical protein